MPNVTDPRIITARPSRLPLVSLAVTILILLLVIAGSIGALLLQQPLRNSSQDVRSQASVANGAVILGTSPVANTTLTVNKTAKIDVTLDTQGTVARQIQLVFHVISSTADTINLQTYSTYNLTVSKQEVQAVSDGFLVSFIAGPTLNQSFVSTSAQPIISITFTPVRTGTFQLAFDTDKSVVTNANNQGDILRTIGTLTYNVQNETDQFAKACNETCGSNAECAANSVCFTGHCRLVSNVTSDTCAAVPAVGPNRQCNESCSVNADCKAGLTCYNNQCRQPDNPDNTTCIHSTAVQQQNMAENCNQFCTDNHGCANNLRCFNNACRLATNTSSTSCSPATAPTVTAVYYTNSSANSVPANEKGAELPGPSPTASNSATPIPATISAYLASPYPSVSPYVIPSPVAETPSAATTNGIGEMLTNLFSGLSGNNSSLLLVAAGIGLLLLVIAAILTIARRGSSTGSTVVTKKTTQVGGTDYERQLQTKISQLQTQTTAPAPGQSLVRTAPVNPMPASPVVSTAMPPANGLTPPPATLRPTTTNQPTTITPPSPGMYSRPSSTRPMTLSTPQMSMPRPAVTSSMPVPPKPPRPSMPTTAAMPTSAPIPAPAPKPAPTVKPATQPATVLSSIMQKPVQPQPQPTVVPVKPIIPTRPTFSVPPAPTQPSTPRPTSPTVPPISQPKLVTQTPTAVSSPKSSSSSMLERIKQRGIVAPKPQK